MSPGAYFRNFTVCDVRRRNSEGGGWCREWMSEFPPLSLSLSLPSYFFLLSSFSPHSTIWMPRKRPLSLWPTSLLWNSGVSLIFIRIWKTEKRQRRKSKKRKGGSAEESKTGSRCWQTCCDGNKPNWWPGACIHACDSIPHLPRGGLRQWWWRRDWGGIWWRRNERTWVIQEIFGKRETKETSWNKPRIMYV